ncbi:hypothetical protein GAMM_350030 [Gammaproteobacteria bacterium]
MGKVFLILNRGIKLANIRIYFCFLFLFTVLVLLSFFSFQMVYASVIDPAEQLEREAQQRKIQEELSHIPLQVKAHEDSGMRFKPFQGCLQINKVNIVGNKLLRDLLNKEEKKYVLPYLNYCVNAQELNDVLIKINSFLFEKGYITSRLEIESYNKKTKELIIKIQEGRIEKFETTAVNHYTAFPGLTGKELKTQDLDQGLAQLNRLPSQYSITTLWPGKEIGGTVVKVDTKKIAKPYRLYLSFDNTGNKRTGQNVLKGNFLYDNLFALNDQLFLAGSRSGLGRDRSAAVTWKEEVPFGYYTLEYSGSYSDSQYDIYPGEKETELATNSFKNKFNLSRTICRGLKHHISLDASFWHYIPRLEFAANHRLRDIEQKLSVVEISGHYDYYSPIFRMLNELNYAQGTRLFGATKDLLHSHAQFKRYKLTSDYLWRIIDRIHLNGDIQIQYAEQGLPGIVKLPVLDGIGGIRGIRANSLTLDDGIIIRHDLVFRLPAPRNKVMKDFMINPFLHGDIGWAKDKTEMGSKFERYSAIGGGVKLNFFGFNAQGTISKLIDKSTKIKGEGWVILFDLSQKIF